MNKSIASLLTGGDESALGASHLQWHDAGVGAVLVNLIHCSLQRHRLLGEVLQVLRALLCFLMRLAHLSKFKQFSQTDPWRPTW